MIASHGIIQELKCVYYQQTLMSQVLPDIESEGHRTIQKYDTEKPPIASVIA